MYTKWFCGKSICSRSSATIWCCVNLPSLVFQAAETFSFMVDEAQWMRPLSYVHLIAFPSPSTIRYPWYLMRDENCNTVKNEWCEFVTEPWRDRDFGPSHRRLYFGPVPLFEIFEILTYEYILISRLLAPRHSIFGKNLRLQTYGWQWTEWWGKTTPKRAAETTSSKCTTTEYSLGSLKNTTRKAEVKTFYLRVMTW